MKRAKYQKWPLWTFGLGLFVMVLLPVKGKTKANSYISVWGRPFPVSLSQCPYAQIYKKGVLKLIQGTCRPDLNPIQSLWDDLEH